MEKHLENHFNFNTERKTMKISYLNDDHKERFASFLDLPDEGNDVLALEYIISGQPDFFNSLNSFVKALITGRGWEEADNNAPPMTDENRLLFMIMEDIAFGGSKMRFRVLGDPDIASETVLFLSVNALILLRDGKAAIESGRQEKQL